ncbi:MAG: hypothetical protein ACE5D7_07905 [Fidelibacterota bacterium]
MSEEQVKDQDVKSDPVEDDVKKPVDSIPYSRFKEVNESLKAANAKLEEMAKKDEERRQKEINAIEDAKAEIANLATQRDELKAKAEEWENYQESRRQALMEKIPEDERELFDGFSDLAKLEKIVEKQFDKPRVNVDTSSPGGKKDFDRKEFLKLSDAEKRNKWEGYLDSFKRN